MSFALKDSREAGMREKLKFLYGQEQGEAVWNRFYGVLEAFSTRLKAATPSAPPNAGFSEKDVILITYGDQSQSMMSLPLQTLNRVLDRYLKGVISHVHLLPFFPYSSDDGFSVIDFRKVDPMLGDWQDIQALGGRFHLMVDGVFNHVSAKHHWFQEFLQGNPTYRDYFITIPPGTDLSLVARPRTSPLLTSTHTREGIKHVWTTFSADQVDLNFANPEVLLAIVEIFLFYIEQGASMVRLDAIPYLWKEPGTNCLHLKETHCIVKLFRDITEAVAPWVKLITESNVPHGENFQYFGDGTDEAHLVYQFPLPPLLLNAMHTGSAKHLIHWAERLRFPSESTAFFNVTATHDGISVNSARGILSEEEIAQLAETTLRHGGKVSQRSGKEGVEEPYELNITFFDALSYPEGREPMELAIRRFLTTQAIALALPGVPGLYFNNLFGLSNNLEGVKATGHDRAINREKPSEHRLEALLADPESKSSQVLRRYSAMVKIRRGEKAFHPNGDMKVMSVHETMFCFTRTSPDQSEHLLTIHNLSDKAQSLVLNLSEYPFDGGKPLRNLLGEDVFEPDGSRRIALAVGAYQSLWLKEKD